MSKPRSLFRFLPVITILVLVGLLGLWVHNQQHQYALNRQLISALVSNNNSLALSLVKEGADPNTHFAPPPRPTFGHMLDKLLHRMPPSTDDTPTAFLIACGVDWDIVHSDHDAFSPIPNMDSAELTKEMLDAGADIHARSGEWSALHKAIVDRRFRTACVLIERGADANELLEDNETLLQLAAEGGDFQTVDKLINHGAKIDTANDSGWTPLCEAIEHTSNLEIVSDLLSHGANPNRAPEEGDMPLSIAEYDNQVEVIKLLKRYGAKGHLQKQPWTVPAIAQILGVRIGYNGQYALERRFGKPMATVGGHPGGRKLWNIVNPPGSVETDGFSYNTDGLVLEDLTWEATAIHDNKVPIAANLAPHSGWLGVVYPGMSEEKVAKLISGRVPPPQKRGNTWSWSARGYVKPSPVNQDIYTIWTAELSFDSGVLTEIRVGCK